MPHQDNLDVDTNLQALKAVFQQLLPTEVEQFQRHGNATIKPDFLAALAVTCWGWSADGTLEDRIQTSLNVVRRVFRVKTTATRQGVMKALASCGDALANLVIDHLASKLPEFKGLWSSGGKVDFAVDGFKFAAPRTQANQEAFSGKAPGNKPHDYESPADESKAATVQVLTTVVWHVNTGLPFRWRVDGSTGSERKELTKMLEELPQNARIIGDAEYVGYPLWSAILASKRSFLVRVGSNVRLLKNLGALKFVDGFVYYWPEKSMRQSEPPLVMRLIVVHNGKEKIYLVTNELDITDVDASRLYKSRWGVEVFFRTIKQSCQRNKLQCYTPQNLLTEINWTLLGIWAAMFIGKQAWRREKRPISRLSPIKVIRAFYTTIRAVSLRATNVKLLPALLAQSIGSDESTRTTSKKSRNYPRKKQHRQSGKPKLKAANALQRRLARIHLE
jgi:hypothetical protein